jgi:hypothetical protein
MYLFIWKIKRYFFFFSKCKLSFFSLREFHVATAVRATVYHKTYKRNLIVMSMNTKAGNSDFPFGTEDKEHKYDGLFQSEKSLT